MKYVRSILLLLVIATCSVYAQMPEYKLVHFGLKGKVKAVTERSGECAEKYGEYRFANNDDNYLTLYLFNQSGNLTSLKHQYKNQEGLNVEKYSYRSDGFTITYYDNNGSFLGSYDEEYTPKNSSHTKYTFYDNGVVKTVIQYRDNGELKHKYTYNLKGQLVEHRKYKEGITTYLVTCTYDKNDCLKSITKTRIGGVIDAITTYQYLKYDSYGNWTMRVTFVQYGEYGNKEAEEITTRMIEYY